MPSSAAVRAASSATVASSSALGSLTLIPITGTPAPDACSANPAWVPPLPEAWTIASIGRPIASAWASSSSPAAT